MGAWYVTGPNYLETIGFGAEDFGWTYSVGPIAGMISHFLVGMIADRFLPSQIVLGILHLIGTAGMYVATTFMTVENPPRHHQHRVLLLHAELLPHRGHRQHRGHEQHC